MNEDPKPYTSAYEITSNTGEIVVVAPLNYLNGSLQFRFKYEIDLCPNYANHIDGPEISTHYNQYLNSERLDPIDICADETMINGIQLVLAYFQFVTDFLKKNKLHPPSFETYETSCESR